MIGVKQRRSSFGLSYVSTAYTAKGVSCFSLPIIKAVESLSLRYKLSRLTLSLYVFFIITTYVKSRSYDFVKLKFYIMFWFIVILIAGIIIAIVQENDRKEKNASRGKELRKKLNELEGFTVTKKITGIDNSYIFAVDQIQKKIVFIKEHIKKVIPFNHIISVEIMEDNVILSQKSSLRTIGGAVVGGVIAGGTGAIVGGLSGDSKQNKKVSKVEVKIKLRDINNPSLTIDCFNCKTMTIEGKPIKPTSLAEGEKYKQGLRDAQQIADTLSVIIDATDRLEKSSSNVTKASDTISAGSVADELAKLAELKERGILTEAEFNTQKQVLLNGPHPSYNKIEANEKDDKIITEEDTILVEVQDAVDRGEYLKAIKIYKELTGCSLVEAKDYVDNLR